MEIETQQVAYSRLLYSDEHLARLGIPFSPTSLRRLEAEKKFPKRVQIGPRTVAWLASEIHEHINKLAAEREVA